MFDTNRTLAQGLGLHQAGRLSEAEQLYRQILAVDPKSGAPFFPYSLFATRYSPLG